ncbi:MAG: B12-binding domain-containing radical SAM protein [Elusimicrobia bacterium]|nr:B12-binding domain-containing radical SAM protein [Elusimicrobiota bacterium]
MIDCLLIYPQLGSMDSMVVDLPLSVLYAAADSVKRGYAVRVLDLRLEGEKWRAQVESCLREGVRLAGVSVMTGHPLKHARELSLFIRERSPSTRIVWGGPHATVLPDTLREPYIDFLVRGYGSTPLADLIERLRAGAEDFQGIQGLSYKRGGEPVHNPRSPAFEVTGFRDIPYGLIDVMSDKYARSYSKSRAFPIFSSIGCPYRCSFCVHPAIYAEINGPKWLPLDEDEVLGHIERVVERYAADRVVFIDDTSFPDLARMRRLFEGMLRRGLRVALEFRGARVNEIDRMDDDFLGLMTRAGAVLIMVGVESGSDRVLGELQKGVTREQILRSNLKLARFPITAHYNFIYGTPGETYEDLLETKDVVLRLLRDNPRAYVGFGGDWKPIPGTRTLETAEAEYGYKPPRTMDDWIEMDSSDAGRKIVHPWYTRRHNGLIKLLQVSSFVIDDKIVKESAGNDSLLFRLLRLFSRIYKPVALFRLRRNLHQGLVEYEAWRLLTRLLPRLRRLG